MTWHERMRDAAYAADIPASWRGIWAGYVNGGDPFHPWSKADWKLAGSNRKLPIFVRSDPTNGSEAEADAWKALEDLFDLGVPTGKIVALDLETAKDPAYVARWGAVVEREMIPWAYGSVSTLFFNPPLHGRWVADYAGAGPIMANGPDVRSTQYTSGRLYDSSTMKPFQYFHRKRWWC